MLKIIKGNILSSQEQYIAHQCNCVTTYAAGLADVIFQKWSYADCYQIRWVSDVPGTIDVRGDGKSLRYVVNMFAQYNPGKPHNGDDVKDGYMARKRYFISCLNEIKKLKPQSVAFPLLVGCGLAGGDHSFYKSALEKFSLQTDVVLYDLTK
jgi:O-acetyl-ADP-ribose deacetylase (regulator of RNase III)